MQDIDREREWQPNLREAEQSPEGEPGEQPGFVAVEHLGVTAMIVGPLRAGLEPGPA